MLCKSTILKKPNCGEAGEEMRKAIVRKIERNSDTSGRKIAHQLNISYISI